MFEYCDCDLLNYIQTNPTISYQTIKRFTSEILQALAFLLKLDHTKAPKQDKPDEAEKHPKTE